MSRFIDTTPKTSAGQVSREESNASGKIAVLPDRTKSVLPMAIASDIFDYLKLGHFNFENSDILEFIQASFINKLWPRNTKLLHGLKQGALE